MPNILSVTSTRTHQRRSNLSHYHYQIEIKSTLWLTTGKFIVDQHNQSSSSGYTRTTLENKSQTHILLLFYLSCSFILPWSALVLLISSIHFFLGARIVIAAWWWINKFKAFRICFLFTFNPPWINPRLKITLNLFVYLLHDPILFG